MVVWQLRKALEQFAPNALVVFWDSDYGLHMTPESLHKINDDDVEVRCVIASDEREANP